MPHRPGAVIFGCEGPQITETEKSFFESADPLGFILFARNCETPDQVKNLVAQLRQSVGRPDAPVLIDQEGGRVQRLTPPHWRKAMSARSLVQAVEANDPGRVAEAVRLNARLLAHELSALGITVNCLPVLDIPQPGSHDVIGDRAFGGGTAQTVRLGQAVCEGLLQGGVLPVMKHIPGHGRAMADSHTSLDIVTASRDQLEAVDFAPFRALNDTPWAMTAHLIYNVLDRDNPATHSSMILRGLIRKDFGYAGVLLSDDVSMNALSGTIGERAARAISAGCDIVLHCNGKMEEMREVADHTDVLSEPAAARVIRGEVKRLNGVSKEPFNVDDAMLRLQGLTGEQA
ncbi:MAG: beta-N-acetylhexosaminidase [Rhodospirillales bacterium]|nr:beta-N-acetylhexosaminidase [Rhodospirillales bacterium]